MKIDKKKILSELKKKPTQGFRIAELTSRFKINEKAGQEEFQRLIDAWMKKGVLFKVKKHLYIHPNLLFGALSINKSGDGFVWVDERNEEFYVSPNLVRNALHGDIVLIGILAKKPSGRLKEAEVLDVVERADAVIVGIYQKKKKDRFAFVVPDDSRFRRDIFIRPNKSNKAQTGQKVVARIDTWEDPYLNPEGSIVEVLGFPHEKGVDILSVIRNFRIESTFPKAVQAECDALSLTIPESEIKKRLDCRAMDCVTIDPDDAKDFDDAVSLQTLENGNQLVGIHIADVSHYLQNLKKTEKEALKRATSVYLVDRVVPMLPEILSNTLCSLRPNEDKLTYSVFVELNAQAGIVDYEIRKTVIRSKYRLTYDQAQQIIAGTGSEIVSPAVASVIAQMQEIALKLRHLRQQSGSIDFDKPEPKFELDAEGHPVNVIRKDRLDSHKLVEDFMLLANRVVAEHIEKHSAKTHKQLPFVYRIHDKPPKEKLATFLNLVKGLGYDGKAREATPGDHSAYSPSFPRKTREDPGRIGRNQIDGKGRIFSRQYWALRPGIRSLYSLHVTDSPFSRCGCS